MVNIRNVKPEKTRLIPSSRPRTDSAEDGSCCQIELEHTDVCTRWDEGRNVFVPYESGNDAT